MRIPALRTETRSYFISPRPVDTECAAQESAILCRNFPESTTGKTRFDEHWLSPPKHPVWVCGETDRLETQGLANLWDIILTNAQDATT